MASIGVIIGMLYTAHYLAEKYTIYDQIGVIFTGIIFFLLIFKVIGFFITFLLSNKIPPQDFKGGITLQFIFSILQPPKLSFFYLLLLIFIPILFILIDRVGNWKNAYIAASIPAW